MKKISTTFSFCGTKNKLIDWLRAKIKFDKEKQIWVEPFCGSCGVGFNFRPKVAIFADANPHLINFYRFIQENKDAVEQIENKMVSYREGIKKDGSDYYYFIRNKFNTNEYFNVFDFFFLSRCGFSHQMRYNRKGELNMAYGKFNEIARDNNNWVETLRIIKKLIDDNLYTFVNASYTELIPKFNGFQNAYFYLDPPYVGTKQDYNADPFNENDLDHLIQLVDDTGCKFAISGMCKFGEENSIKEKYSKYHIEFKESLYTVSSNAITRASEMLVMN